MKYKYLVLAGVMGTCFHSRADAQALTNTGVFTVLSGTTVTASDLTNTSTATFVNNGSLNVSGNISNDQAAMAAGTGTLTLNGTSAQTLSGAAPFRSLNVTLNNAAGMTLTNRLAIGDGTGGLLTFTAGNITSGTNTQDVYFYPGSGYTGFDASHQVIGYVTKSGNTDFTFPIGDGTHKADLDLTGISAATDFQVLYNGSGYGTYTATSPLVPTAVYNKEWWDIAKTAGSGSAQVTLKWDDSRNIFNHSDPTNLVVAHFTGGTWQTVGGTSSNPSSSSTGSVGPSNAVTSFSPFTFGSLTVALPITLSSFGVMDKNCHAALTWTTQIEDNAAGFDIQESTDGGGTYTSVGFVKANGRASTYNYTVDQTSKQAEYRIRLVDLDGSSVYSQVASLQLTCLGSGTSFSVYPNPASAGMELTVRYVAPVSRGEAQVQIFDMNGRRVQSSVVQVNNGTNIYTIPSGSLAQGLYTVYVVGDGWNTGGIKLVVSQ